MTHSDSEGDDRDPRVDDVRLRAFVDSARDALVCVDENAKIVEWSRAADRMFGWTREEALGRELPELVLRVDDRAAHSTLFATWDRGDVSATHKRLELSGVHRSGLEIPLEVEISASRATGALEFHEVFRDIHERRASEKEQAHAHRLDAIGTLSASVAHDFNNVLSVVISFASLLREGLPEASQEREDATTIVDAAQRAVALTRQLLAFARKQVLEPRVIDTSDELDSLIRSLRVLLPENVSLETTVPQRLSRIEIDPVQLEQVLLNFVVNARDAMPEGGAVTISAQNVSIPGPGGGDVPPGLAPGRYVQMSVSDTGGGVPDDIRERIFEPLFTTKAPGRGTGLGLATVRRIMEELGGAVTLTSAPGQGSTFRVYFPRAKTQSSMTLPSIRPSVALRGTESILLVEDDDHVRGVLRRVLLQAGYGVVDCATPGEALLIVEKDPRKPALVIADVMLPRLSGNELLDRLLALHPAMKTLLISGYAPPPSPRPFLGKPFLPNDLLRKVREVLTSGAEAPARSDGS